MKTKQIQTPEDGNKNIGCGWSSGSDKVRNSRTNQQYSRCIISRGNSIKICLISTALILIIPLSHELNNKNDEYEIKKKFFNHLFYIHELK